MKQTNYRGSIMKQSLVLLLIIGSMIGCKSTNPKVIIETDINAAMINLTDKLKQVYIANNKISKQRLAVFPIMNEDGNKSRLGILSSNLIQDAIFDPKYFSLLERERIDSIINEHEFQSSGMVKEDYIKQIGEKLGADLVLVGTINRTNINNNSYFSYSIRLVDVSSGEIKAISNTNVLFSISLVDKYNDIYYEKNDGLFKVKFISIKIDPTKPSGLDWDADGSGPDIQIFVKTSQSNIYSNVYYDRYQQLSDINNPFFSGNVMIQNADSIAISVWDIDILDDDLIGQITLSDQDVKDVIRNKTKTIKAGSAEIVLSIEKAK
jgi:hypothetical protein